MIKVWCSRALLSHCLTITLIFLLASNKLKGDIPHEFSKLSLVTLDVGGNNLGGPLVTEIGLMSHLEVLRVNDNHLSGEIPTELGRLKHLNELCMYGNQFSGRLPSELSELVGLGMRQYMLAVQVRIRNYLTCVFDPH